jgi:hypothetical protein
VTEVLPQLEITEDMDTDEKLKILKSRYPEFEPLAALEMAVALLSRLLRKPSRLLVEDP